MSPLNGLTYEDIIRGEKDYEGTFEICYINEELLNSLLYVDYPRISSIFNKVESHWHFKLRMFVRWFRKLPYRLRWKIFPYFIIHKKTLEELLVSC